MSAVNDRKVAAVRDKTIARLMRERDELKAAVANILDHMDRRGMGGWPVAEMARAALASLEPKKDDAA